MLPAYKKFHMTRHVMPKERSKTSFKTTKTGVVHTGSVQSFADFQIWKTGLSLGPCPGGSKDRTGLDFQTLIQKLIFVVN
jgi:hypothetical protein